MKVTCLKCATWFLLIIIPFLAFPQLKIGDRFQGGIVINIDSLDKSHGLICSDHNLTPNEVQYADALAAIDSANGWRMPSLHELVFMWNAFPPPNANNVRLSGGYYWSNLPEGAAVRFWGPGPPVAVMRRTENDGDFCMVRAVKNF